MNRIPFGDRRQHRVAAGTPQILVGDCHSAPPDRFRLAVWQRRGMVPADVPGATIAKGYRWAHGGRDPHRDPERRACRAYSEQELRAALRALGLLTPQQQTDATAAPLALLWRLALQKLELPSMRMLLSQQAQLLAVRQGFPLLADVLVVADWLPTVHSRRRLIEAALLQAWGEPVALQLEVSW